MRLSNGSIIGNDNTPTANVASGVWSLFEQARYNRISLWPLYVAPVSSYTIIQSFTASGSWVCPTGVTEVEYLVVAGGGGGGFEDVGGELGDDGYNYVQKDNVNDVGKASIGFTDRRKIQGICGKVS